MNRVGYRYIVLFCILAAGLLCSACDNEMPALQNIAQEQQTTTPESIEIIISHNQSVNTPEDIAARAMCDKLQELLGDNGEVILYADYQLGSAQEQLEALELGRIHITIQSAAYASQYVEDWKVLALPYLFSSDAQRVIDVLDGPLEQELLERAALESESPVFKGLGLWFGGYKLFTFHGDDYKQIQSPADFQGLSIAVADSSLLQSQYRHWGAEPIVTDQVELYSTLAEHLADGTEATLSQIAANYLYEVQHNVVQAYHSAEIYAVVADAQWFAGLSSDLQNAIIQAEIYGKETLYRTLAEKEPVYLDLIRQTEAMHFETLNEKELDIFKTSVQSIYTEQLAGSPWQMDFVQRIQKCFT